MHSKRQTSKLQKSLVKKTYLRCLKVLRYLLSGLRIVIGFGIHTQPHLVYDLLHVGNFRGPIFFNFLRNWLEHRGYEVEYVYNYTDIDDKIINKSHQENKSIKEVSEKYIDEFKKDYDSLKIKRPTKTPKCTEHIDDIIEDLKSALDAA